MTDSRFVLTLHADTAPEMQRLLKLLGEPLGRDDAPKQLTAEAPAAAPTPAPATKRGRGKKAATATEAEAAAETAAADEPVEEITVDALRAAVSETMQALGAEATRMILKTQFKVNGVSEIPGSKRAAFLQAMAEAREVAQ